MRLLLGSVLLFFAVSMSHAADFSAFAGNWKVNEAATVQHWRDTAKTAEQKKNVEKMIELKRQLKEQVNLAFHADLQVSPRSLIGHRSILSPRYDLIRADEKDGVIFARVLHHEDKNDPGDASEEDITVSKIGGRLCLQVNIDFPLPYLFDRE